MKVWIIFDGRAWTQDTDDCAVYEVFSEPEENLKDVRRARKERWPDGVIFEYDEEKGKDGENYLVNQRLIGK